MKHGRMHGQTTQSAEALDTSLTIPVSPSAQGILKAETKQGGLAHR